MAAKKNFFVECGLGFGNCTPRYDTIARYNVEASTERGAKIVAKRRYNEMLAKNGKAKADVYGFVFRVLAVHE